MAVYTVHEPPLKKYEAAPDPERFAFVRDGFSFWAFVFGPLWMLRHRMWLVLLGYIVVVGGNAGRPGRDRRIGRQFDIRGLHSGALVGLEAGTLRRFTLGRRRWRNVGTIVGDPTATRSSSNFFNSWVRGETVAPISPAMPARPRDLPAASPTRGAARTGRHRPVSAARGAPVTVAIVDYGAGNLHSAAKAFERAAREIRLHAADRGDAAVPTRSRGPIASCSPASAPLPTAGMVSTPSRA